MTRWAPSTYLKRRVLAVLLADGASWDATEMLDHLRREGVEVMAKDVAAAFMALALAGKATVEKVERPGWGRNRYTARRP